MEQQAQIEEEKEEEAQMNSVGEFNKLAALIVEKDEPDKDMHFNFFPKREKIEKVKGGGIEEDQTTVDIDLTAKGAAVKQKLTGIFDDDKEDADGGGALDSGARAESPSARWPLWHGVGRQNASSRGIAITRTIW